jgi:hypothetical protein
MSEGNIDLQMVYAKLLDEVFLVRSLLIEKYLTEPDKSDYFVQESTIGVIENEICKLLKFSRVKL